MARGEESLDRSSADPPGSAADYPLANLNVAGVAMVRNGVVLSLDGQTPKPGFGLTIRAAVRHSHPPRETPGWVA